MFLISAALFPTSAFRSSGRVSSTVLLNDLFPPLVLGLSALGPVLKFGVCANPGPRELSFFSPLPPSAGGGQEDAPVGVQAFGGHRALARGGVPARRLALRRCPAGLDPRELARERTGRKASCLIPGTHENERR